MFPIQHDAHLIRRSVSVIAELFFLISEGKIGFQFFV